MAGTKPVERIESTRRKSTGVVPSPPPAAPKVELRSMTGYEEEVAERRRNESNTAALCNEIVARCMVPPGIDHHEALSRVRNLLIARRDEALLKVRQLSLGDVVNTIVTCPVCRKQNEVNFPLSALPVEIKDAPERVEVDLGDLGVAVMRLPTAGDQEDLLNTRIQSESERRTWLLARVLLACGKQQGPFDMEFARGLPLTARHKLEEALEGVVPDLDLTMALNCVECNQAFKSAFDVSAFFFCRDEAACSAGNA